MFGSRPRSPRRAGGFLTFLLVGALLLCHGVFGFAHEISHGCGSPSLLASMSPAGHDHDPAGQAAHAAGPATGDDPVGGHAFAGYFGIVLALFGVALLALLPGARKPNRDAIPRPYRTRPLPVLVRPPRGPTLPLLQVFRL